MNLYDVGHRFRKAVTEIRVTMGDADQVVLAGGIKLPLNQDFIDSLSAIIVRCRVAGYYPIFGKL